MKRAWCERSLNWKQFVARGPNTMYEPTCLHLLTGSVFFKVIVLLQSFHIQWSQAAVRQISQWRQKNMSTALERQVSINNACWVISCFFFSVKVVQMSEQYSDQMRARSRRYGTVQTEGSELSSFLQTWDQTTKQEPVWHNFSSSSNLQRSHWPVSTPWWCRPRASSRSPGSWDASARATSWSCTGRRRWSAPRKSLPTPCPAAPHRQTLPETRKKKTSISNEFKSSDREDVVGFFFFWMNESRELLMCLVKNRCDKCLPLYHRAKLDERFLFLNTSQALN